MSEAVPHNSVASDAAENRSTRLPPQFSPFLPDWSSVCFPVLEPRLRVASELEHEWLYRMRRRRQESREDVRQVLERRVRFPTACRASEALVLLRDPQAQGVIMLADGMERECAVLLGRIHAARLSPRILLILNDRHTELLPFLADAGAESVLFHPVSDIEIVTWCLQVLTTRKH